MKNTRSSSDAKDGTVQVRMADGTVDKIESVPDVPVLTGVQAGSRISKLMNEAAIE